MGGFYFPNANPFAYTGGFGSYKAIRDYTFNATATGAYAIFTVTGDVIVRLIPVCTTAVVTVGNVGTISVGIAGNVAFLNPVIVGDLLAAREIWHDATPDSEIELLSTMKEVIITDGNDIQIDLLVAAFTSGVIRFYCIWTPLSADGSVIAT